MLRVKICGNRSRNDLKCSIMAGADAVGFIVGARHYTEDELSMEQAAELLTKVPVFVTSVLVTHLIDVEEILATHRAVPTAAIQLHDAIPLPDIDVLRKELPHVHLIKSVHVLDESAIAEAHDAAPLVDAILLDSRTTDRIGGTGVVHDWSISRQIVDLIDKPTILAGGLTPENVGEAIALVRPFGVDVNSGVDDESGDKDQTKTSQFVSMAKSSQP